MSGFGGGGPQLSLPRFTRAVKAILIACGVVYVCELIINNISGLARLGLLGYVALTPGHVLRKWPWLWELFTYLWIHHPSDPSHILFNMLGLWLVGALLEQRWGTRAFVQFYLLTGLFAALTVVGTAWVMKTLDVQVFGASGPVEGLMVAFGILYPDMPIYFFGVIPMKGKHFVLILIGMNLLYALARQDGVSVAAHFGGMASGALLVTGLWRPSRIRFKLFGPPKAKARKMPQHLKVVPSEPDDDEDHGGNGKSRMLH
jgi:rhomboid family protein